ncbi:MAG: hypothetical protein JST00_14230 [Deltaproteobacteria bacterium]|nr:hypothetical protein [Deltaproteobacteria bacterium]
MSSSRRELVDRVHDHLDAAAAFERALDFTAAASRGRDATALVARLSADGSSELDALAQEVTLETGHFDASEAVWRGEVEMRSASYVAREVAEAYGHLEATERPRAR